MTRWPRACGTIRNVVRTTGTSSKNPSIWRTRSRRKSGHCVVVDCLTLWLAQWICPDCQPPQEESWEAERAALLELLPTLPGKIVLVSNEVGMGIVPLGEINRRFQDEQGRLNQAVAAACEHVTFIAAGLPLQLKG